MKVCALVVTYNDRFKYLEKVIDQLLQSDINGIIVIDNNSSLNSCDQLNTLEKKYSGWLKAIYLNENIGSAGGYFAGLQEFYRMDDYDFVWLLDDDNVPEKNALDIIKKFWLNLNSKDKEDNIALLSYRNDRNIYYEAVLKNNPDMVIGQKNGFLGFDLRTYLIRKRNKLFNIQSSDRLHMDENIEYGKVSASYYGGLFFHKKLLDGIGYPNPEFFVYMDDIEFTSRINKAGGVLYVLFKSKINDIDEKWKDNKENESVLELPSINELNVDRFYYQLRNRLYFEKHYWITNRFIFQINKNVYILVLKLVMLFNRKLKYKWIIKRAIKDALENKLGRRTNIY